MRKQEFLNELGGRLSGLSQNDIDERLAFYSEMIDDRIEEGMTEEEAVNAIGSVKEIADRIMSEIPLSRLVMDKVKPKKGLGAGTIVLLILGAPLWLPLLIAAFAVVLSIYISIWAIAISFYAVNLSLGLVSVCTIPVAVHYFSLGNTYTGLFMIGSGIALAGITILLFLACLVLTKGIVAIAKGFLMWIKSLFVGKEAVSHA